MTSPPNSERPWQVRGRRYLGAFIFALAFMVMSWVGGLTHSVVAEALRFPPQRFSVAVGLGLLALIVSYFFWRRRRRTSRTPPPA